MDKENLEKPIILDNKIGNQKQDFNNLINSPSVKVIDEIDSILEELYFVKNPERKFNSTENDLDFLINKELGIKLKKDFGKWVFYPWNNSLVHIPDKKEFELLRTVRNRLLITEKEQDKLQNFTVGVLGLSVGNSIALSLCYSGISNKIKLADPDKLSLSNLNRIRAKTTDIGLNKAVLAAHQIYEVNPYAEVEVYPNEINNTNLEEFLDGVDLLIEEVDDFSLKILARLEAKKNKIPFIMVTDNAEIIMLDIERYDINPNYPIFHGLAGDIENKTMENLTKEERVELATRIVGKENVTPRMSQSLREVGHSLVSWPQLATTVFAGGGVGAYVAKQIALGNKISSKRFIINIDEKLVDK